LKVRRVIVLARTVLKVVVSQLEPQARSLYKNIDDRMHFEKCPHGAPISIHGELPAAKRSRCDVKGAEQQ